MASIAIGDPNLIGKIFFLPRLSDDEAQAHSLQSAACNHPCVIVDHQTSSKSSRTTIAICVITSLKSRDVDKAVPISERQHFLPIFPKKINNHAGTSQLKLQDGSLMPKESYVKTRPVFQVPFAILQKFEGDRLRLNIGSINMLRAKLRQKPFLTQGIDAETSPYLMDMQSHLHSSPSEREIRNHILLPADPQRQPLPLDQPREVTTMIDPNSAIRTSLPLCFERGFEVSRQTQNMLSDPLALRRSSPARTVVAPPRSYRPMSHYAPPNPSPERPDRMSISTLLLLASAAITALLVCVGYLKMKSL